MKTFKGVYKIRGKLATLNSTPGYKVYDERIERKGGKEYRIWDPYRSKLAAALANDLETPAFKKDTNILYLGASSGTTPSHLADICSEGEIYCVEFSRRMMRDLLYVADKKKNLVPILADATKPGEYLRKLSDIDVIYQDVAQSRQAEILLKNTELFNPQHAFLAIKARSINAVKSPKQIFKEEKEQLRDAFEILQTIDLKPFDKDHVFLNLKRK